MTMKMASAKIPFYFKGRKMCYKHISTNGMNFRCSRARSSSCRGSAVVCDQGVVREVSAHTCTPDEFFEAGIVVARLEMRTVVDALARADLSKSPQEIFTEAL
uniref:FLYWCH-type domain-containing protein n=1 Tax=Spongospora subterranea TaxID=70186 RepID=A0A0H5QHG4_9EUKA|eukprot:CRZ01412.1 hypothetical protein [Spongospora subterranea]